MKVLILCFSLIQLSLIALNSPIDTLKIQKVIEKNRNLKYAISDACLFKILVYKKANSDTTFIKFKYFSNPEWNKKNDAYEDFYTGFLIKENDFILNGVYTSSTKVGKNISETSTGNFTNNKENGMRISRTPTNLSLQECYKDGLKNGVSIIYFGDLSNTVCRILFYKDDTLNGDFFSFYSNGSIWEKSRYLSEKLNGEYISYYENGEIASTRVYSNDVLNGKYEEFYKNGKIKSHGEYTGNYILITVYSDSSEVETFKFSDVKGNELHVFETYSKEFSEEMWLDIKNWYMNRARNETTKKYSLKKGTWIYYNEIGQEIKKVKYAANGDATIISK